MLNKVGEFEKVSYQEFHAAMSKVADIAYDDSYIKVFYMDLTLPTRAASGSAGYDFKSPFNFTFQPGQSLKYLPASV